MTRLNQAQSLFPVSMSVDWQNAEAVCQLHQPSSLLRDWLLDPMSLTKRLKQHCQTFHVELLGQELATCSAQEASDEIQEGDEVLIREVLLYCDGQPHVFARSLLPLETLTGEEKKLATLGNQSLGQVLFNDPALIRKGIELAYFSTEQQSRFSSLLEALSLPLNVPLFGRRSIFVSNNKPLMVAEFFLPNALAYQSDAPLFINSTQ